LNLTDIQRVAISAVFADDVLYGTLVLKGGAALDIVHGIGKRTSLDLDFSMENDFTDLKVAEDRLRATLVSRFEEVNMIVFDVKLERQPPHVPVEKIPNDWGGYLLKFKIISKERNTKLGGNLERMRKQAESVTPDGKRIFTIDISRREFCDGKVSVEVESFSGFAYSPLMIACEKLRAICQQHDDYSLLVHKRPRGRDFYDIYNIAEESGFPISYSTRELITKMFEVKRVPLRLLEKVGEMREFHRQDWAAVMNRIGRATIKFDQYFDYVVRLIEKLDMLGHK
jgi:predicted nucleotidyltransferase component of viral defense system